MDYEHRASKFRRYLPQVRKKYSFKPHNKIVKSIIIWDSGYCDYGEKFSTIRSDNVIGISINCDPSTDWHFK